RPRVVVARPTDLLHPHSFPTRRSSDLFSLALPLAEGPNIITATATAGGAVGTASIEVTLDTTPPHVTITSPPDGFVTTDGLISVDRKSTRLNSSHQIISYAVFCLKTKT